MPARIFELLLATSGALALVIYFIIALSQVSTRRRLDAEGVHPPVRMWLFPWLTYATMAFIAAVLLLMLVLEGQRVQLGLSAGLTVAVLLVGVLVTRRRGAAPVGGR